MTRTKVDPTAAGVTNLPASMERGPSARWLSPTAGAIMIAALLLATALPVAGEPASVSELHGSGRYQRTDLPAGDEAQDTSRAGARAQRWQIEALRFAEGTVLGRVQLQGSNLGSDGNLEGRIRGSEVQGTIADDAGAVLVRFDGRISRSGMSGTYEDRTGEKGEWTWDGELPLEGG